MIITQSTPQDDNPFYRLRLQARAYGQALNQMRQIMYQLSLHPEVPITVISLDKEYRKRFLEMAEHNHVGFEASEVEPYGPGAWQFTIKEWKEL